jgi:hypothetical protein
VRSGGLTKQAAAQTRPKHSITATSMFLNSSISLSFPLFARLRAVNPVCPWTLRIHLPAINNQYSFQQLLPVVAG